MWHEIFEHLHDAICYANMLGCKFVAMPFTMLMFCCTCRVGEWPEWCSAHSGTWKVPKEPWHRKRHHCNIVALFTMVTHHSKVCVTPFSWNCQGHSSTAFFVTTVHDWPTQVFQFPHLAFSVHKVVLDRYLVIACFHFMLFSPFIIGSHASMPPLPESTTWHN